MISTSEPLVRVVLIAGVPRSGSTWSFNAARLILTKSGADLHTAWIDNYDGPNACDAPVHLVKAHQPEQVKFTPDVVITTYRDPAACLLSLMRMGWLADTPDAIQRAWKHHHRLYHHWRERRSVEILYEDILGAPAKAVQDIAQALQCVLPAEDIAEIAQTLADMSTPQSGAFDPETLLHPDHRSQPEDNQAEAEKLERIHQIIRSADA